jgi:NO-binding membrane sensor protein with MHYT domain
MMQDILTWSHLSVLVALGGFCLAIWKIRQADLREIDRKIEATAISLAAFKLHVAELHPTAVELSQIEARLSASLDRLSSRIDRLLERDGR